MTAISDAIDTVWNNMAGGSLSADASTLLSALIVFCFVVIVLIIAAYYSFPPADESNRKWQRLIFGVAFVILCIVEVVTFLLRLGYI